MCYINTFSLISKVLRYWATTKVQISFYWSRAQRPILLLIGPGTLGGWVVSSNYRNKSEYAGPCYLIEWWGQVINALPRGRFDYNPEVPGSLEALNAELETEGLSLFYVKGDVCTSAIVAVAHGVLLNVDLVYGRHDGGAFDMRAEEWREYKEQHSGVYPVFRLLLCTGGIWRLCPKSKILLFLSIFSIWRTSKNNIFFI